MVRHSLYQRSARTWPLVYSLAKTYSSGPPSTRSRSGVDAGRRFQADGFDLEHGQPELVDARPAGSRRAPAADVDVSGLAPAVDDREDLVRGEVAERRDRYRDPERDAEEHVVGVIDGQVQPGQAEHRDQHGHGRLGVSARPAGHHQAVHRAHEEDRQHGDRRRRRRVPAPAADDRDAVRARPGQAKVDPLPHDLEEEQAAQEDQQVPPAPEDHGQRDHRQAHRSDPPAAAGRLDSAGQAGQPRRPRIRELAQEPGVGPVVVPEPWRVLGEQEGAGHDHDSQHEPGRGAEPEWMRQRWRRAGRTPLPGSARAGPGGAAGASVCSVFSLTGHPAFLGRAAQASRSGTTPFSSSVYRRASARHRAVVKVGLGPSRPLFMRLWNEWTIVRLDHRVLRPGSRHVVAGLAVAGLALALLPGSWPGTKSAQVPGGERGGASATLPGGGA